MASSRREKRLRQTYPGPNSADNQQMLQDIKDTLDNHQRAQVATAAVSTSAGSERERSLAAGTTSSGSGSAGSGSERDYSMKTDHSTTGGSRDVSGRRSSPPSDREHHGSPGATPRMPPQSRSTPTKQLGSSSDWNKQTMKEIKKQLRPFASSDPGFHPARDRVNKKMLMQLINYGYNEVRSKASWATGVAFIKRHSVLGKRGRALVN